MRKSFGWPPCHRQGGLFLFHFLATIDYDVNVDKNAIRVYITPIHSHEQRRSESVDCFHLLDSLTELHRLSDVCLKLTRSRIDWIL